MLKSSSVTEELFKKVGRAPKSNEPAPQRLNFVSLVKSNSHRGRAISLFQLKASSVKLGKEAGGKNGKKPLATQKAKKKKKKERISNRFSRVMNPVHSLTKTKKPPQRNQRSPLEQLRHRGRENSQENFRAGRLPSWQERLFDNYRLEFGENNDTCNSQSVFDVISRLGWVSLQLF